MGTLDPAAADGSVKACPPGLSGSVWSELAAVRKVVERMVAARRGGHPAPPSPDQVSAFLTAAVPRVH